MCVRGGTQEEFFVTSDEREMSGKLTTNECEANEQKNEEMQGKTS